MVTMQTYCSNINNSNNSNSNYNNNTTNNNSNIRVLSGVPERLNKKKNRHTYTNTHITQTQYPPTQKVRNFVRNSIIIITPFNIPLSRSRAVSISSARRGRTKRIYYYYYSGYDLSFSWRVGRGGSTKSAPPQLVVLGFVSSIFLRKNQIPVAIHEQVF